MAGRRCPTSAHCKASAPAQRAQHAQRPQPGLRGAHLGAGGDGAKHCIWDKVHCS